MYQFDAVGSPTANYSNFATKLIKFGELTVVYTDFYFTPDFSPDCFIL